MIMMMISMMMMTLMICNRAKMRFDVLPSDRKKDHGVEDEREVMMKMKWVMSTMAIVVMVVTALRKSRGLILLMRLGLLSLIADNDGQWK